MINRYRITKRRYVIACKYIMILAGVMFLIRPGYSSPRGQISSSNYQTNSITLAEQEGTRQRSVSVQFKGVQLQKVLKVLAHRADIGISFKSKLIPQKKITYSGYKQPIFKVLKSILMDTNLHAELSPNGQAIFIKEREKAIADKKVVPPHVVSGVVTDKQTEETVPGVNILVKGTTRGTTTNSQGEYKMNLFRAKGDTLVFSFVGYKKQEIAVNGRFTINVALETSINSLEDLVVTGIVERNTDTFTGTTSSYSGDELRSIGNNNIVESLKTIDPSFVVLENNNFGDDPNHLPTIEVRGRTSTSQTSLKNEFGGDPNQPLFVLDGFETTLQQVVDLDMDRVKSISILKDAASTALYGAKAANGVVVIETKQPKRGALRVTYSGDLRITDPDLSSYNLMDAEQKLEFEKKSGYYTDDIYPQYQALRDSIYNARLANVRRGQDTYWLDEPVRTGITQGHSIYVESGAGELRYGLGVHYRNENGVMKGSDRNTWSGNLDLIYRKNKLNVTNKLTINGFNADDSPYGSFVDYARANPYYGMTSSEGELTPYLDQSSFGLTQATTPNPLYNAGLNSIASNKHFDVQNNLQMNYQFTQTMRLQGGLQLKKGNETGVNYVPPLNTQFAGASIFERGNYSNTQTDQFSYRGNITFTYAKVFAEKHRLTFNARGEIEDNENERVRNVAVGFPAGSNGNPAFAHSYAPDSSPATNFRTFRRNSALASANYSYDRRYLLDATYRIDGSTAFGSADQYSPYYSAGIGWNLHNEDWFDVPGINTLRLRANIGITGNQNLGNIASASIYQYDNDTNIFGQGIGLQTLGNPNLEPQKTTETNFSLDLKLFDSRVDATISAYQKKTDPLVVVLNQPSSTGVNGNPTNVGTLNTRGIEANIKVQPIYHPQKGFIWRVGILGSFVRSKYGDFNNLINSLNEQALQNSTLIRYRNGYSPDDIWAVRSAGIDPATGRELFIRPDGENTFDYHAQDEVAVGNKRPVVEGVVSNTFTLKAFTLGLNIRYRFGGDVFNRALYNKVENISQGDLIYNQDARALTDRWQEPGDVAKFKSIKDTGTTPISSRFVQEQNIISGESIRLGYRVTSAKWLRSIGLSSFRVNVYANNIFRISSVKAERGINYPFARNISSSINISF